MRGISVSGFPHSQGARADNGIRRVDTRKDLVKSGKAIGFTVRWLGKP